MEWLSYCTHEEPDIRVLLHDADSVGYVGKQIFIITANIAAVLVTVNLPCTVRCENVCFEFDRANTPSNI